MGKNEKGQHVETNQGNLQADTETKAQRQEDQASATRVEIKLLPQTEFER